MDSALADQMSDNTPSSSSPDCCEGPFVVREVSDVFELLDGCCTIGDVQILWRMLRDEGCLRLEAEHAVIELPTEEALQARAARAKIAARRERSMLGRYDALE